MGGEKAAQGSSSELQNALHPSPQASSFARPLEDRHGCARGLLKRTVGVGQRDPLKEPRPTNPSRESIQVLLTSAADARASATSPQRRRRREPTTKKTKTKGWSPTS